MSSLLPSGDMRALSGACIVDWDEWNLDFTLQ